MGSRDSYFLSDAPVKWGENQLWAEDSEVIEQIRQIADEILNARGALTFAIHGVWGMGKTSFLQMVEGAAKEKLETAMKEGRAAPQVEFCWYTASLYQGSGDAAKTLTQRIISTLSGKDSRVGEMFYEQIAGPLPSELEWPDRDGVESSPRLFALLERIAEKVAVLADLGELLEEYLVYGGAAERKLVLIIDDLDRCTSVFAGNVVDALQRLSGIQGLFVLMAVDEEKLHKAIATRYKDVTEVPQDIRWALQKHVQYAFTLPVLKHERLGEYAYKVLEGSEDLVSQLLRGEKERELLA